MRYKNYAMLAGVLLALVTTHAYAKKPKAPDSKAAVEATRAGLSLDEAIRQALLYAPRLKSEREAVGSSQGDRQQSGLRPNPELGFEAENILGTGAKSGFKEAEMTLGVAQPVELGGKRSARIKAANHQVSLAQLKFESAALDLARDVTVAWAEAVAATEEVKLAKDRKKLSGEVLVSVSRRVEAAAEPVIQKSKAEVSLASSKIELQKAERHQQAAMKKFLQLIGSEEAVVLDTKSFFAIHRLAANEETALENNPDLKKLETGIRLAEANLNLEQANAVPDVTFEVGVRDARDTNDQSFLAGVSIPFPVFNRNQGSILRAGHEVTKASHDKVATINDLKLALSQSEGSVDTAYAEAASLKKTILPAAERAFSQARDGYKAGKFPYLEVLDAQRTLFEVRTQHISALSEYHTAKAELERLTGKHIGLVAAQGEKK